MKNRYFVLAILAFFSYTLNAFAISAPMVGNIPATVEGDTYVITVHTMDGATVSVVGGSSQLAPVTDGAGSDELDGDVQIEVPLVRNSVNTFSITAELNGDVSDAISVDITEESTPVAGTYPVPNPPVLNPIPDVVDTAQYIITGKTEANMNIYVRTVAGETVVTTQGDASGDFQATVALEKGVTNRFNISAENDDGVEGKAVQAVIRQSGVWEPEAEAGSEAEPTLYTSSQLFFGDIQGHWAEDYINQLYEAEVVSGKSEGVFDPNGLITRAELTKIAILAFGHSINPTPSEHPFQDVPLNSWYAPYVEEAKRLGFVSGYDTGGFGPNDFITRAAALKILLGAAGINASGMSPDFPDVSEDAWYATYVGFAQEEGIVGGYNDGTFGPGNNMTRAQVAKVVIKLLEYLEAQAS